MLVLSRHRDQDIIINGNIIVKVLEIRGDKVRLGIEAPPNISVHRREVQEAIERKGDEAVHPSDDPSVVSIVDPSIITDDSETGIIADNTETDDPVTNLNIDPAFAARVLERIQARTQGRDYGKPALVAKKAIEDELYASNSAEPSRESDGEVSE